MSYTSATGRLDYALGLLEPCGRDADCAPGLQCCMLKCSEPHVPACTGKGIVCDPGEVWERYAGCVRRPTPVVAAPVAPRSLLGVGLVGAAIVGGIVLFAGRKKRNR